MTLQAPGENPTYATPLIPVLPRVISPEAAMRPAHSFLEEAVDTMKARAALRDTSSGERTAKQIAEVFNALTKHTLTEADAWTFLLVMKMVRARSGSFHADDYVDLSAYAGLLGECESLREVKD